MKEEENHMAESIRQISVRREQRFRKVSYVVIAAVLFVLLVVLTGCSTGTNASAKAVSVAEQAIAITDSYLDGIVTGDEVYEKLNELRGDMSYIDDMATEPTDKDQNYYADLLIDTDLLLLSSAVSRDDYNGTSDTYDQVIEYRNGLASDARLKQR